VSEYGKLFVEKKKKKVPRGEYGKMIVAGVEPAAFCGFQLITEIVKQTL
jgi:hypothetical protein